MNLIVGHFTTLTRPVQGRPTFFSTLWEEPLALYLDLAPQPLTVGELIPGSNLIPLAGAPVAPMHGARDGLYSVGAVSVTNGGSDISNIHDRRLAQNLNYDQARLKLLLRYYDHPM